MLTRIIGGEIIDPVNGRSGQGDLWIRDGHIADPPNEGVPLTTRSMQPDCIVMAGAIDIHSHIGGGNVNTARLLLPEHHAAHSSRPATTPLSNAGWSTFETGCLYAKMGFTTVVEPAMVPGNALHTHLELADIPIIDKATLAILGNDDFLLSMIRDNASTQMIDDYVAWTVGSTRALGVKVINAGAAAAFKENVRKFSLDDVVPSYGVSSRTIVKIASSLSRAAWHPASAACPLQQSRSARRSRYRGGDDRCVGGRSAASRPSSVLWLWHRGQTEILICCGAARRIGQWIHPK